MPSVQINKFIRAEQELAIALQTFGLIPALDQFPAYGGFFTRRRATEHQAIGRSYPLVGLRRGEFARDTTSQSDGLFNGERIVQ